MTMLLGSLYRYAHGQLGWTSRSSEILETRLLRFGSPLFHWGILMVIAGHVMGLLVPMAWYDALGITPVLYHRFADMLGGVAGLMAWSGVAILLYRRITVVRVRRTSSISDWVSLILLFIVVSSGDAITLVYNNLHGAYEYRASVGPWFRGLFTLHPTPALMASVPAIFQAHIILAFLLFGVWPFTRLVHAFSLPLAYSRRAPIQYRSRTGVGRRPTKPVPSAAPSIQRRPGP